jgi:hypothetical protein
MNFRNREVGTRDKRGMTVFVWKVNFFKPTWLCKLLYAALQVNVLNSVTTFFFPHPFQLVITETSVFGTA